MQKEGTTVGVFACLEQLKVCSFSFILCFASVFAFAPMQKRSIAQNINKWKKSKIEAAPNKQKHLMSAGNFLSFACIKDVSQLTR